MPWDLCCAVGAVVAPEPCIFLFDGGTVVTYAFVGQSYGAVAAGAVTNRRGVAASRSGCCAGAACCSTCCATGACCGCCCVCCCVVCGCRCCAGAALLRFLCGQGVFFCAVGFSIVGRRRATAARGCASAVGSTALAAAAGKVTAPCAYIRTEQFYNNIFTKILRLKI